MQRRFTGNTEEFVTEKFMLRNVRITMRNVYCMNVSFASQKCYSSVSGIVHLVQYFTRTNDVSAPRTCSGSCASQIGCSSMLILGVDHLSQRFIVVKGSTNDKQKMTATYVGVS